MGAFDIAQQDSPNCGPRRNGLRPEFIVIHYTAMQSAQAALERLCDPEAEVSAHYVIAATGRVTQMVPEEQRAWHAGAGEWRGLSDINSRSIGIELDNRGDHPFPEPQMSNLEGLLKGIMTRWGIRPEGVIGHSDMAPGRKVDPGARFDWLRLERRGLAGARGRGAAPEQVTEAAFHACAVAAGYTADVDHTTLLETVRLRYRPWATGPLDACDFMPLLSNGLEPPVA